MESRTATEYGQNFIFIKYLFKKGQNYSVDQIRKQKLRLGNKMRLS